MDLTTTISKELVTKLDLPNFKAGDNITVYYKIKEGSKERIQFYEGTVIAKKNSSINCNSTDFVKQNAFLTLYDIKQETIDKLFVKN